MSATAFVRGHAVVFDGSWRYADNGGDASCADRACVRCNRLPTPEGFDACLGHIPGATSACCGHGVIAPFVVYRATPCKYPDGECQHDHA